MALEFDEAAQVRRVEETLLDKLGDRLPKDRICGEVQEYYQRYADARVRTFVPVLIERQAMESLRHAAT
jgi:hypothetical protein